MSGPRNQLSNRGKDTLKDIKKFTSHQLKSIVDKGQPLPIGYCFCKVCNQPRLVSKIGSGICSPCQAKTGMEEAARQVLDLTSGVAEKISRAEEAKRARAWQLANLLRPAPARFDQLKREGWTEQGLLILIEECPDWFHLDLATVSLTTEGRFILFREKK